MKLPIFCRERLIRKAIGAESFFDFDRLYELADRRCREFKEARPFPHVLIDELISPELSRHVMAAIPRPAEPGWRQQEVNVSGAKAQFNKLGMADQLKMPPIIRQLLNEMNSGPFLQFLEQLTGIKGLLADPSLQGGGVHQTLRGGVLGVHSDFTRHKVYCLDRRLNVLLYLNENWLPEYGGHLELWSRDLSECKRRIMPILGRCVVFATDSSSFHGHPQPVNCPLGQTRKSLALYYYTNGRDDEVVLTHRTNFQSTADGPSKPPLE